MRSPLLPAPLHQKLARLARHVRRRRLLRGLSLVVLVPAIGFLAVFLGDLALDFTEETLSLCLTILASATALTLLFGLLLPLRRPVDFNALAARIEQKHPELAERLTSSIELTRGQESHGGAAFIGQLLEETEQRTRRMVFRHAFPARATRRLVLATAVVLALAVLPGLLLAERYAEFTQRFVTSWFAPPALRLEVTPGDGYAARGRPLSWTATLHRRDGRIAWPASANLIVTDKAGRMKQILMQTKTDGAAELRQFTCGVDQVSDDFDFFVDAGSVRSDVHKLTAVEPVALSQKPTVKITPPPYANKDVVGEMQLLGPDHVNAVEFSSIMLTLDFNRAPVVSHCTVTREAKTGQQQQTWAVALLANEASVNSQSLVLPALTAGNYRLTLHLEAEQHISTDIDLPELTIHADQPPTFTMLPSFFGSGDKGGAIVKKLLQPGVESVAASPLLDYGQASAVAPSDAVHLKVGVADEEGLDRLEIDYRINNGPVQSQIMAKGNGVLKLEVDHALKLKGKVKDGDIVQFRFKAVDNRQVSAGQFTDAAGEKTPSAALKPQVVYYPSATGKDQWLTLKVDSKAGGLQEQEFAAQHDAVQKQIDAVKKKIEQERKDLGLLDQFGKNHAYWTVEQGHQLAKLRKDNHGVKNDLVDIALKTLPIPELNSISLGTYELAKQEMTKSDSALSLAQELKGNAGPRDKQLAKADQELQQALKKLDALSKANDEVAKNRVDQMQLQQLAQKEEELSQQVAELQAKQPLNDPKLQAELNKLQAEQKQAAEQVEKLAQQNALVQAALQKTKAEQAHQLAQEAKKLAEAQQELVQQMEQAVAVREKNILEEFAKKQQVIADKAAELGQQTNQAAQSRQVLPLNPQPAQLAVASIKKAAVAQALGEQEQSAKELARLAENLDGVLLVAGDAADVLKTLLQKQRALEKQLLDEAAQVAHKSQEQLAKSMYQIYKGQTAVHEAARKLSAGSAVFGDFEKKAGQAALSLKKFDALQAWDDMQQATLALEALSRTPLAGKLPNLKANPLEKPPAAKDVDSAIQAQQLRELAKEQWELRKELQKLLANPDLSGPPLEKIVKKQQELQKQGSELMEKLAKLAQTHGDTPEAKQQAADAAKSGADAHQAMQKAKQQSEKGKGLSAKQAAEEAANLLMQAAKKADETAAKLGNGKPPSDKDAPALKEAKEMAQALAKGQQQADAAKNELDGGQLKAAAKSMKSAAKALNQSAQQMAMQMQKSTGGQNPSRVSYASPLGAMPDLSKYGGDGKKYGGKSWGQLPGQLKSKVLADLRAQYGEEYAAIIQRYFEEQAAAESKKN